jgi:hypothetical protein
MTRIAEYERTLSQTLLTEIGGCAAFVSTV